MTSLARQSTGHELRERGGTVGSTTPRRKRIATTGTKLSSGEIMTCDEVAEYLRVHVSSVRRWSRSGKLTAYRVGGRGDWRYREQDVLSFLYDTTREGKGQREVVVMLKG